MKIILRSIIALGLAACIAGGAVADPPKQCRDPKTGHFIKCPPPTPPVTIKCRDKTTKKFAKCSAPNSEPVPNPTPATNTPKPPG